MTIDSVKKFVLANVAFIIIMLIVLMLMFKVNGVSGGLNYLALIFCISLPVVFLRDMIGNFINKNRNVGASDSSDAENDKPIDWKSQLIPYAVAGVICLLLMLLVFDGRERSFVITYTIILFLCLLAFDLVLAGFKKAVGEPGS